jgi:rhodanese-related sulfurtransferase
MKKRALIALLSAAGLAYVGQLSASAGCGSCTAEEGAHAKGAPECSQGTCPVAGKAAHQPAIGTDHLKVLLRSGVPLVVLDARSGQYDDGRRIASAKTLTAESSEADVEKVIPSKDSLVVTYCAGVKCPASSKLAAHLVALGYNNVLEYPEGIEGWTQSGNQVVKAN